jgi:hypothetical protein
MRDQVLMLYIASLLESQQLYWELVPQYLPLVGAPHRELLAHELLQLLTQELTLAPITVRRQQQQQKSWMDVDDRCARIYWSLAHWFQRCLLRQEIQQSLEQGLEIDVTDSSAACSISPTNALKTTVRYVTFEREVEIMIFYENDKDWHVLSLVH